jgi:hypothetical protein
MTKKYALLIGTNNYEDESFKSLKTPTSDVKMLADLLLSEDVGEFDEVKTLTNSDFAHSFSSIGAFFSNKEIDDLLFFYYSGHGVRDEKGKLFLTCLNTENNNLSGTSISSRYLKETMDDCISNRIVIILDCCFSGAFGVGIKGNEPAITKQTFISKDYGRVVMTATDSVEYAFEDENHSNFSGIIIKGLSTGDADLNQDGFISINDLFKYVSTEIGTFSRKQTPKLWGYNLQGDLILTKRIAFSIPTSLRINLHSNNDEIRLQAITKLHELIESNNFLQGYLAYKELLRISENDISPFIRNTAREFLPITTKQKDRDFHGFMIRTDKVNELCNKLKKEKFEIGKILVNIREIDNQLDYAWYSNSKKPLDEQIADILTNLDSSYKVSSDVIQKIEQYVENFRKADT